MPVAAYGVCPILRHHRGACRPGDDNHSFRWAATSN
jgi:hypothetical protein